MKKLIQTVGKVLFWLTWPGLFIYFRIGRRTRVFVICHQQVLVLKSWYGDGSYIFPGGGLHRREDPRQGVLRELYEETGLKLPESQLQFLFEKSVSAPQKLTYKCVAFGAVLDNMPSSVEPRGEIAEITWRPVSEVLALKHTGPLLKLALDTWDKQGKNAKI